MPETVTVTLPPTVVDYIDYNTYANFFASDIPVMIADVPFLISINTHFDTDLQAGPNSTIQFWNQVTGEQDSIPWGGAISTLAHGVDDHPAIEGTFEGMVGGVPTSGGFSLVLTRHTRVYRISHTWWTQDNGTLTVTQ